MPRTINAIYPGNLYVHPTDLLKVARDRLNKAELQASALEKELRSKLAGRLAVLKKRAYERASRTAALCLEKELDSTLRAFKETRKKLVQETSRQSLDLAISIAREIIADEVKRKPETLLRRIRRALNETRPRQVLGVRVAQGFAGRIPELPRGVSEDPALQPGDAVIHTSAGKVALDWREHLHNVATRLKGDLDRYLSENTSAEGPHAATFKP